MSSLSITKSYGDAQLLYASDIHNMWSELEAKTNGSIDRDNVNANWANLGMVTLAKDTSFTLGATSTAYLKFFTSDNSLKIGNTGSLKDTIFKCEGSEVARIDVTTNNLSFQKDVYFTSSGAGSSTYSLFRLIGAYRKPVLVYVDSDTIDVENNTETSIETLIVFPSRVFSVAENTASTHKFRRLKLSATANGYGSSHTGAADSGLRTGLSLSANTWYFVYAVRVRYGDDAGSNFILVVDDTSPVSTNESTLDSRYGTGEWVYLGTIRRGFGAYTTTTLVPFQQDHQGFTHFIDRASSGYLYGVVITDSVITSTTNTSVWTMSIANSGYAVPANVHSIRVGLVATEDGDSEIDGTWEFGLSTTSKLFQLPFYRNSNSNSHGIQIDLPVISGSVISNRRATSATDNDSYQTVYLSGFLDHYV